MQEIRWIQRFENYKKALSNLNETVQYIKEHGLNKIYIMALVEAFEIAFELGWKTLKDYLEYTGTLTDTPRDTIKTAFSQNIIKNGKCWIEMMEARNKTSHTYREDFANQLADDILNNYFTELQNLEKILQEKI